MKISGSIRQTGHKRRRFVGSRQSPPRLVWPGGTVRPGPDAHQSGPGPFSFGRPPKAFCTVPKPGPSLAGTSYIIPLERKSRLAAVRRNSNE